MGGNLEDESVADATGDRLGREVDGVVQRALAGCCRGLRRVHAQLGGRLRDTAARLGRASVWLGFSGWGDFWGPSQNRLN